MGLTLGWVMQADLRPGSRQEAEEQAEAELSHAFDKADFAKMRVVSHASQRCISWHCC